MGGSHGGSYEEFSTDVSEAHIDSIFRVEKAEKDTCHCSFEPEDRGDVPAKYRLPFNGVQGFIITHLLLICY
jgi:hypothetical protein